MSKMPAKKKSCFQITSVTQAQVAAIGAADDTESLEDPDESRAEDASSEMYDASRTEFEPTADRGMLEEVADNAGEPEPTVAPAHLPHFSVLSVNSLGDFQKAPASGIGASAASQQAAPTSSSGPLAVSVNTSQPAPGPGPPPPAASAAACTSRFRVIKLDHGTGEPFRRGRWMCTEYYEKESEGSVANRAAVGAVPEPAADRDGGAAQTGGSAVAPEIHSTQASGASPDLARLNPADTSAQQNSIARQQDGGRSGKPATTAVQPAATGVHVQPVAPQSVGNGLPHVQKSPILPPSAQAYQLSVGHHLTGQNQPEHYQQQLGQSLSGSGSSAGPPTGQVTSPAPAHFGDGGAGKSAPPQTVGTGNVAASVPASGFTPGQYAGAVQFQPQGLHPGPPAVQNVPVTAASAGTPPAALGGSGVATPKGTSGGQATQGQTAGASAAHGLLAAGFGQTEGGGGRKSDGVANAPLLGRDLGKPFMPESLQLAAPTVNSLFGIHIPVDGDEDSASGTNIVAIDNKIEQAMDLVKSHLMYAVREEVEVLKEQIKELFERNSVLERENAVLKSLANSEQLSQLPAAPPQPPQAQQPQQPQAPQTHPQPDASQQQPNVTSS
ncbi:TSC22 domain family protein 2-like isoform X2 [Corythoichthys intestinalis]|uniref:TSC22 domain family protein 2-like isoform X2 n=1 Tax=Corythoichthys intestinalis TaxID=161448 RepID=UPI0025A587AF|nr:TSC22 domain family protein 2-like isoform X2 [Corythoichthys intestinalis]